MTAAPTGTIRALEGLRGLSALGIVVFHLAPAFAHTPQYVHLTFAFSKYYLLLDLFFIVSGFGLAGGAAKRLANGLTAKAVLTFYRERAVRLFPLHLVVLAALVALEFWLAGRVAAGQIELWFTPLQRPEADVSALPLTALLLHAWGFIDKLSWNVPSWFLSALLFPYLLFPFIAWAARNWSSAQRALVFIGAGGAGAAVLHYFYVLNTWPGPQDWSILRALAEFLIGMGLAALSRQSLSPLRRVAQIPLLVLVFVSLHLKWHDIISVTLLAALFWSLLTDDGPVAKLFGTRPLVFLGTISFAVFMTHYAVLLLIDVAGRLGIPAITWFFWTDHMWFNVPLRVVIILLVGWAAYSGIERPSARLFGRAANT